MEDNNKLLQRIVSVSSREIADEAKRLARLARHDVDNLSYSKRLRLLADLPTDLNRPRPMSLLAATKVFSKSHFGLENVKTSILDYIAVVLNGGSNHSVLLLEGPSGVGKTSIAETIAKVLNRPIFALSSVSQSAVKGYQPTIDGAEPGDVVRGVIKHKSLHPVILIDEIDKVGGSQKTLATLLELLDPIQNHSFKDLFLGVGIDLSDAIFICTANDTSAIPTPLMSRMDVISVDAYTLAEKVAIVRNYLLPSIQKSLNISYRFFGLSDDAIEEIALGYTKEAGVRNLKTIITKIGQKVVKEKLEGKKRKRSISSSEIEHFLGARSYEQAADTVETGVAIGMLYSDEGGETLIVESSIIQNNAKLDVSVTGLPQEVMQDSARIALSYVASRYAKEGRIVDSKFHIHLPDGSTAKDGPSAGVAFFASLMSTMTGIPLPRIAMTGEITLKGRVLPVGAVKAKIEGSYHAKVREFIVPAGNESDVLKLSKKIRSMIVVHFVSNLEEVYAILFDSQRL